MNAVGADEDIGFDLAAVGKARGSSAAARFDANAARPRRMSLDRSAPARTPSRSARCTVRLGAPSARGNRPDNARNLPAALPGTYDREFQFPPIVLILSSRPSARSALMAFGTIPIPAPISLSPGDCSQRMTSACCRSSAKAGASPPMPPPTRMRGIRSMRFSPVVRMPIGQRGANVLFGPLRPPIRADGCLTGPSCHSAWIAGQGCIADEGIADQNMADESLADESGPEENQPGRKRARHFSTPAA